MTDEAKMYKAIGREFEGEHDRVFDKQYDYAHGDVTTNTIEGVFALLKRSLTGTYHSVTKKHLHRYLSEVEYRYNTREMDDGERTAMALRQRLREAPDLQGPDRMTTTRRGLILQGRAIENAHSVRQLPTSAATAKFAYRRRWIERIALVQRLSASSQLGAVSRVGASCYSDVFGEIESHGDTTCCLPTSQ